MFYVLKSEPDREFSLVKYLIAGNTENKAAWKRQTTIKSFNVNPDDSYILRARITFSNLGNSSKYVRSGWAHAVLNHRTMIAKTGACSLSLKNYTDGDLELMVTGGPVSRELQSSFVMHVFAGDEKIDTWNITSFKHYNTIIPAALIKNNKLSLKFEAEQINKSKPVQDKRLFLVSLMQINSR